MAAITKPFLAAALIGWPVAAFLAAAGASRNKTLFAPAALVGIYSALCTGYYISFKR